jgi:hypothetical protein
MWLRVAALLGGRSVEEWQATMTGEEFSEWRAFYAFEPWGWEAQNWRMGVVASTVANYSGNIKKPVKPSDFMPGAAKKRPSMNPLELRARMAADVEKAKRNGDD